MTINLFQKIFNKNKQSETLEEQPKPKKPRNAAKAKKWANILAINFLVLFVALLVLFPFYIMIITSIKPFGEALYFSWFPSKVSFDAYKFILVPNEETSALDLNLLRSFGNTLLSVVPGTTVGVFVSAAAGYIYAKHNFTGKNVMFVLLLSALMIPSVVMMVPLYLIYAKIGWVDTLLPLIIPSMFGTTGLVFAFRQYMYSIPNELIESAKLDGAGQIRTMISIVLPLAKPIIVAQWLLMFMAGYNQYVEPLLYIFDPKRETIQLTLARYSQTIGVSNMPVVMASAAIGLVPLVILYASAQKFFAQGIMAGSLKG